jgi:hypothetical protein
MLALFGAPPPQATQTLPRLSLCLHACADTAYASDDFPLPLLSLSFPGTSTRSAASGIGGGGDGGGGDDDDDDDGG